MAYILADTREKHGGASKRHSDPIDFIQKVIVEDNKKNQKTSGTIQYIMKQVKTGDYAIILPSKNPEDKKPILAAVFERKTWQDLAGSIKDNRITQQHKNLENIREKTGCYVYYIIEGIMARSDDTLVARMPYKNLYSKVLHNSLRGVHFIQTKSAEDTAQLIVKVARSIIKLVAAGDISLGPTREINEFLRRYKNHPQFEQLKAAFQAVSETPKKPLLVKKESPLAKKESPLVKKENTPLAKKESPLVKKENPPLAKKESPLAKKEEPEIEEIIEQKEDSNEPKEDDLEIPLELDEKHIKEDVDVAINGWMQFPGVGLATASALVKVISLRELVTGSKDELIKKISKISCGGALIGTKAEKIVKADLSADGIGPDILSQAKGVSVSTAKAILSHYDIEDIFKGYVNEDDVSEIKVDNRRIGKSVAKNIFKLLEFEPEG